jgi:hypothetical protein
MLVHDAPVTARQYPCPCCGFFTHDEEPGDFEYCDVCGWQDDLSQLRFPAMAGGANRLSLLESQRAFLAQALPPTAAGVDRDPAWRPLDPDVDHIELPERGRDYGMTYAEDRTEYYYWRSNTRPDPDAP